MKMKTLAVAVAALAGGSQVFAAEVYNSDGTSLSIGGHVSVGVGEYFEEEVKVHQVSPRINIGGKKDIGNGVTIDAKGEWSLNYLNGGDNSFSTRLGYIGATHDQFGRLVVGTQWSPYYDVAGVADMPIAFANDFLYENHYNLGSGRAEKMVSYRKGLEFGDGFGLNIGLGWQGEQSIYDQRGQIALSTELAGFGLGYVYSGGDIELGSKSESATSHMFSAKYGQYGAGIYAALVYGMNEYFYDNLEETSQYEAVLAYGLDSGLNLIAHYESVEDDKNDKTQYSNMSVQAEYTVTPAFVTFAAYRFGLGDDVDPAPGDLDLDEDFWTIGARYYF
ncbi:hypothetical protein BCT11_21880 [Vibrio sp. 10N.222.52.B12]|uniref:Porin n=1 Tax=Vibrio jasicida TaxID=766224 RepID=A0AAU9QHB9_9VIBR|nr:porin [Vibrio sp. 10N.222.52.B12]PMO36006.1 hypothetical protein BCT11_21880 [Vibrio sp. 10N.222.52.B12]CAH1567057.1 conserved exported hypothetical protein [Vibrio jasicida]CAH1577880.1 conserved exported hypothetical protein [Vibrio jasicida]